MKHLIKNIGDHFNLPESAVNELNIDELVETAIEIESGRRPTVRVCEKNYLLLLTNYKTFFDKYKFLKYPKILTISLPEYKPG